MEVEVMELAIRDLDPPPDLGLDAQYGQLELVDGGGLLGGFIGQLFLGHGRLTWIACTQGNPFLFLSL